MTAGLYTVENVGNHLKGAVSISLIISNNVKSKLTHVYRWKSKNNGLVLLKWLLYRIENNAEHVYGCDWPGWKWNPT